MIVQQSPSMIDALAGVISGMMMKKKAKAVTFTASLPSIKDTMQTSFPLPVPANENSLGPIAKMTKAEAKADLVRLLTVYQIPSQNKLALRWGRPKGTVSKWLKDFEAAGLISRKRTAKTKRIARN
jgi:hypothetical protein